MLSKRDQELLLEFARGDLSLTELAQRRGGQPVATTLAFIHADEAATFLADIRKALDVQATLIASHTRIKAIKTLDAITADAEAPAESRRKAADAALRMAEAIETRDLARQQHAAKREQALLAAAERAARKDRQTQHRSYERELREAQQLLATADALDQLIKAAESPPATAAA